MTTRLWIPNGENGVLVEPSCWLRLRGENGLKKYKSKKMILLPSIYAGCITMGLVTLSIFSEFLFFSWSEDRVLSPGCNFKCLS